MDFQKSYHTLSQIGFNTLLLVLLLNLPIGLYYYWQDSRTEAKIQKEERDRNKIRVGQPKLSPQRNGYQMWWVDLRSYEGVNSKRVEQVLNDFFLHQKEGSVFRPYVHFANPVIQTPTLTIKRDRLGFEYRPHPHHKINSNQTKHYEIFVFGGSTTFGFNVANDWTIPYYLESILNQASNNTTPVRVSNYGRSDYSWYQEMVLFQRLLHAGHRPDAVIFIDGVNVINNLGATNLPNRTRTLQELWDQAQYGGQAIHIPARIPLFRFINDLGAYRYERAFRNKFEKRNPKLPLKPGPNQAKAIIDSYLVTLKQIQGISKEFGIQTKFVWQPHRAYRCENKKYARPLPRDYIETMESIYTEFEARKLNSVINLARLCETWATDKMVFIDDLHYSPKFNHHIASKIAKHLGFPNDQNHL